MRSSISLAKKLVFSSCKALMICAIAVSASAETINLNANFQLFGEVYRFGLGYGDMALHFGVNNSGNAPEIGSLGYYPGGTPFTTGVLSSTSLPRGGLGVVNTTFSVPFSLNIDQPSSMYIGFGDNGIGGSEGGSVQVIFDFSPNIYFVGSILQSTPGQGLNLTSITLQDGTPLADTGLQFNFILDNTVLTAAASAFDDQGLGLISNVVTPPNRGCSDLSTWVSTCRAAVFPWNGTATSQLSSPSRQALLILLLTLNLIRLSTIWRLQPLVVLGNVVLTRTSNAVPEPPTILLLGTGFIAVLGCRLRKRKPGSKRFPDGACGIRT